MIDGFWIQSCINWALQLPGKNRHCVMRSTVSGIFKSSSIFSTHAGSEFLTADQGVQKSISPVMGRKLVAWTTMFLKIMVRLHAFSHAWN